MPLVNAGQRLTAALLSEDYSQADTSVFGPITATTTTQATKAWNIPANDAQVNTVYRLTSGGAGVQGSTLQSLRANLKPGGAAQIFFPTNFISVSSAFGFRLITECTILSTGVTGTACASISLSIGNTTGPGFLAAGGFAQSFTFNTTIAQSMFHQLWWGAATGAPTVTCYTSLFERCGG